MQVNLKKGLSFNLQKSIARISVQTGWDVSTKPGEQFDVDLWVLGLSQSPSGSKLYNDGSHAVLYANPGLKKLPNKSFQTHDGSITHTGDNRTGVGGGVDEQIDIDLDKLPPEVDEITVFISIHEAAARKQTFGQVKSTFIRVQNSDTKEDLCQYDMAKEFTNDTVVQVGALIKESGIWSFKAIGAGAAAPADINTVLANY